MNLFRLQEKGFTLIELLVVVIIVAVLAAVAVPLLSGNITRARSSEAEATLGTIRTAMRAYYAEHRDYNIPGDFPPGIQLRDTGATPPIVSDLDGRFFSEECYAVAGGADDFTATCTWDDSDETYAPRASEVNNTGNVTQLDAAGEFTRTGY